MPDSYESLRQDMQKETAQELGSFQRHFALLAAMSIILPPEGDTLAIERQQAVIRNCDPMRIAAQIPQNVFRASKGKFGVDYPVLAMQAAQKLMELFRFRQHGGGAGTV